MESEGRVISHSECGRRKETSSENQMVAAGLLQAGCCATNLLPGSQTSWSSSSPWHLILAPALQFAISSIALMEFVAGPRWKQDQCSDARLKKNKTVLCADGHYLAQGGSPANSINS